MAGVAIVAAVPDDIAETHKGIVQLFSSTDDQRSVRESGQAIAALDESTKARHLEMQQSIKELTGVTNRMLDELNDRKSNLLDPTTKRELLAQKSRAEDNIRRMQEDNASLQYQVGALSNKATDLTTSEQQIKQREINEVKRAKHTISLYANISSIKWDYSSPNVKGWITAGAASTGRMRAFEMERGSHSDFQVVNHLWNLMDSV